MCGLSGNIGVRLRPSRARRTLDASTGTQMARRCVVAKTIIVRKVRGVEVALVVGTEDMVPACFVFRVVVVLGTRCPVLAVERLEVRVMRRREAGSGVVRALPIDVLISERKRVVTLSGASASRGPSTEEETAEHVQVLAAPTKTGTATTGRSVSA